MRLRDRAASFLRQQRNYSVVVLAVLVHAIMVNACRPTHSWLRHGQLGSIGGQVLLKPNLAQLQTKFSKMRVTAGEDISVEQPSPSHKKLPVVETLSRLKNVGFLRVHSLPALKSVWSDWKRNVLFLLRPYELFLRGFAFNTLGKEVMNRWHSGSIAGILPSGSELPKVRAYRNQCCKLSSFDAVEYDIGTLNGVQGLLSCIGGALSSLGSFFVGAPHQTSEYGIDNQNEKAKPLQSKCPPIYPITLCINGYLAMLLGWRWRIRAHHRWRDWWIGFVLMISGFTASVWGGMLCADRIFGVF
jgi:hypothetical protein